MWMGVGLFTQKTAMRWQVMASSCTSGLEMAATRGTMCTFIYLRTGALSRAGSSWEPGLTQIWPRNTPLPTDCSVLSQSAPKNAHTMEVPSPATCWAQKNSIITRAFLRDGIWGEPTDAEGGIRTDIRNNSFSKGVAMHWSRGGVTIL